MSGSACELEDLLSGKKRKEGKDNRNIKLIRPSTHVGRRRATNGFQEENRVAEKGGKKQVL